MQSCTGRSVIWLGRKCHGCYRILLRFLSQIPRDGGRKTISEGPRGDQLRLQSNFSTSKDNRLLRKSGNSTVDKAKEASEATGTDQVFRNAEVPSRLLNLDERW